MAPQSGDLDRPLGPAPRSCGSRFGQGGHCPVKPGDVIGAAFDQGDFPRMIFWHNGVPIQAAELKGMKGEQWPALALESCTIDWIFNESDFKHKDKVPSSFSEMIMSKGLI
eukprot:gnl/MRDRNA2_/MRDRNA2_71614_c0_seq2.p1 gnl/MRDRNA2_/MRDRNA2_71614_c0~~gnl/MRDRNA2_/MRDRNA2_71614_c0_seq2.p1  ORF type:complete len:111 (-),score=17.17 gnl/MRDRNA2_/MRDRNA2_71614_c0_seq2:68-400(-)